jgi:hypothetical protein
VTLKSTAAGPGETGPYPTYLPLHSIFTVVEVGGFRSSLPCLTGHRQYEGASYLVSRLLSSLGLLFPARLYFSRYSTIECPVVTTTGLPILSLAAASVEHHVPAASVALMTTLEGLPRSACLSSLCVPQLNTLYSRRTGDDASDPFLISPRFGIRIHFPTISKLLVHPQEPRMSSRKLTSVYKLKQALRRSIKGEKESKPHVTIAPKSAVAIVPPKKVRFDCPIHLLGNCRIADAESCRRS